MFERYWDFYEMINDYYIKNPVSNVKIVTKDRDEEDGGGSSQQIMRRMRAALTKRRRND